MPVSVLDLALLTVASGAAFAFGWTTRHRAASGQEAALKRSLYDAKGAIPQLEASVRTRDQRIQTIQIETDALRAKLTSLEASLTQRDGEIVKRDRELRRLSTELQIAKEIDGADQARPSPVRLIEDGSDTPPPATDADARLKKVEARYAAMKRAVLARDDRIAELEAALKTVPNAGVESEVDALNRRIQADAGELAHRDATIKALEARVREEAEQREQLETLARRRTETNREIKEKLLKTEQQLPKLMDSLAARSALLAERDAALRDVRTELTHMTAERDARDRRIDELAETVVARDEALKLRDARIQTQQASGQVLEQRIEALTHDLAAREQSLKRAEALIRERDEALAGQRVKQAAVDAEAAEQELAAETLRNALRDRDFRIDTLVADVGRLTAALEAERRVSAVSAPDEAADRTATELNALRDRVETLARHNERLQNDAAAAAHDRAELERERARLAERIVALESADGNQVRVLESQLAAARLRCERAEDELLQASREAKSLRQRVAVLEAGGEDAPGEDAGREDELPDAAALLPGMRTAAPRDSGARP